MSNINKGVAELPTQPVTAAANETLNPIGVIHPALLPLTFSAGLDSFAISNTRSLHKDTDFVSVSLAVAHRAPLSQTRALGDLNNGHFPLNMVFSHVTIAPGEKAVLTYNMVNSGHQKPSEVEQGLEKATTTLAQKGAQIAATAIGSAIGAELGASIGTAVVPLIGTAIGVLVGYLTGSIFGILFANCDGPVASAVHVLTYEDVKAALATGHGVTHTDDHPGVDSSVGCGSNSHYTVTWSVK